MATTLAATALSWAFWASISKVASAEARAGCIRVAMSEVKQLRNLACPAPTPEAGTPAPSSSVEISSLGSASLVGISAFDFQSAEVRWGFREAVAASLQLDKASDVGITEVTESGGASDEPLLPSEEEQDAAGSGDSFGRRLKGQEVAMAAAVNVSHVLHAGDAPGAEPMLWAMGPSGAGAIHRQLAGDEEVTLNVEYLVKRTIRNASAIEHYVQELNDQMQASAFAASVASVLANATGKAVVLRAHAVPPCQPDLAAAMAAAAAEAAAGNASLGGTCKCSNGEERRSTWVFRNSTGWHDSVLFCAPSQPRAALTQWVAAKWAAAPDAFAAIQSSDALAALTAALVRAHGSGQTAVELASAWTDSLEYRVAAAAAEAEPASAGGCPSQLIAEAIAGAGLARRASSVAVECHDLSVSPLRTMPQMPLPQWRRLASHALEAAPRPGAARVTAVSPTLLHLTLVPGWLPSESKTEPEGSFARPLLDATAVAAAAAEFQVCSLMPDGAEETCQAPTLASLKRRILWAPLLKDELSMGEHVFVRLGDSALGGATGVQGDFTVSIPGRLLGAAAALTLRGRYDADGFSEVLHLSHFGFRPGDHKRAFAGLFLGTAGELPLTPQVFRVLRLDEREPPVAAFEAMAEPALSSGWPARYDPQIYQRVLVLDFSALRLPGRYTVELPPFGRSMPFEISAHAYRRPLAVAALGALHTRCGVPLRLPWTPFERDREHELDAFVHSAATLPGWFKEALRARPGAWAGSDEPRWHSALEGEHLEATGGHHDAGDYGKYTHNGAKVVWLFFTAFDVLGQRVLGHDRLALPNSGNGISDLLEEALWELKWLMNMQDPTDGGVFNILKPPGSKYEHGMPHRDIRRVLLPKDSIPTAAYASALARAARSPVLQGHDASLAAELGRRALLAWRWLELHAPIADETNHSDDTNDKVWHYGATYGSRDERASAALELYGLTGEARFLAAVERLYRPEAKTWSVVELPEFFGYATRSCALWGLGGTAAAQLPGPLAARCLRAFREGVDGMLRTIAGTPYDVALHANSKAWHTSGWFFPTDQAFDLLLADELLPTGFKALGRGLCQGTDAGGTGGLWWSSKRVDNTVVLQTKAVGKDDTEIDVVPGLQRCRDACNSNEACVAITYAWVGFHACRFHCSSPVQQQPEADTDAALLSCMEASALADPLPEDSLKVTVANSTDAADGLLGDTSLERWCFAKVAGAYAEAALAQVHYVFGANPLDFSFLTGAGWRRLRSTVDQESVMDSVGEPVAGMPVSPVITGAYWLQNYGQKLGRPTEPTGNPWSEGAVYPMLDQAYDGWNVEAEFTIEKLTALLLILAAVSPPAALTGAQGGDSLLPSLHPEVNIRLHEDLLFGEVIAEVELAAVAGTGVCSLRWTIDQDGEGRAVSLAPRCDIRQDYAAPIYRLSVEVEECMGVRGYTARRLNTRDYNNTAIPLAPLAASSSTLALLHFDGSLHGTIIGVSSVLSTGAMRFDRENLDWLDFRTKGPKGQALRLAGGDSSVSCVFSGRVLERADVREIRVEALVYVEQLVPRGARATEILSLKKTWRDSMILQWERWSHSSAIIFGEVTAKSTRQLAGIFPLHQWHFLQLSVNSSHLTHCVDGACTAIPDAETLPRWLSPEDFRATAGNFAGLLDELHVSVLHDEAAPERSASELCLDAASSDALPWRPRRGDMPGLGRSGGLCQVPRWQSVDLEEVFANDDLLELTVEALFVRGSEGSVALHPAQTSAEGGWEPVAGSGMRAQYDGTDGLQVSSNNLGWAPQMFEDHADIWPAGTGAEDGILVRLIACGRYSEVQLARASADAAGEAAFAPAAGTQATVVSSRYNWRFTAPPFNMSIVLAGTLRQVRILRTGGSRCWRREDLPQDRPPEAEGFLENCSGSGAMWRASGSLPLAWRPRFQVVGGSSYENGECAVVTHQFAMLFAHFRAPFGQPLLVSLRLNAGASGGFSMYQDPRGDGFYVPDGIGIVISAGGAQAVLRSNNLGYAPQTITSQTAISSAEPLQIMLSICGQRTLAWAVPDTSGGEAPGGEELRLPGAELPPFHDSGDNWRFVPEMPWMARLNEGRAREFRVARGRPEDWTLLC